MKLKYFTFTVIVLFSNCRNVEIENKIIPKKKIDIEILKNNNIFPRTYDEDNFIDLDIDTFKIKDGSYIGLFEDSTIAFTGRFINGKQDGIFHYFYLNGKLKHTEIYANGIEDGHYAYYDTMGFVTECGQIKLGKRDGVFYTWWDYKTLLGRTEYLNDMQVGEASHYYKSGQIESKSFYKNGLTEGCYTHYFENGTIEEEGNYHLGYQVGEWKSYYSNGNIKSLTYFTDKIGLKEKGIIHKNSNHMGFIYFPTKTWMIYDSLGNLRRKIYHDNNYKVKLIVELNEKGNIISSIEYNGQTFYICSRNPGFKIKDGKEIEYYDNGKVKTFGINKMNKKEGQWFYYDSLGVQTKTEFYKNDTLITK